MVGFRLHGHIYVCIYNTKISLQIQLSGLVQILESLWEHVSALRHYHPP